MSVRSVRKSRFVARSFVARTLAALTLCCSLAPRSARANGRFPNAEQLRPLATGSLVVAGTYGLLVSANRVDFQYVCESSLFGTTLKGSWVDPLLELLPDGTILSGSLNGLRVSRDSGCTFSSDWSLPHDLTFIPADPGASGPPGKVVDLCPAYDAQNGVIALTTVDDAQGMLLEHRLYHSSDGAKTWTLLGAPIPSTMARTVLTVDVAPSDPTHIYVSGNALGTSLLLASSNGGTNFTPHALTLADNGGVQGLYIAAVSPTDPNRVYLRVARRSDTPDGTTTHDDSLLVTDDAGAMVTDVLRKQASLLGFALSPDGQTVLAGYGDPQVPPDVTNPDDLGLYSADATSLGFGVQVPALPVSCLRWTADALYACASEIDPLGTSPTAHDFHVGVYKGSALPTALSDFTPLVKLKDVRGPLPNANGQPSSCNAEWSSGDPGNPGQLSACSSFNACSAGGTVPLAAGAVECGASSGGAAGSAGSSAAGASAGQSGAGQGGTGASAGQSGAATSGAAPVAAAAPSKGGCSCRAAGQPSSSGFAAALAALALALKRRRESSL